MRFDHERLDVYRASLSFVVTSNRLVGDLPPGYGYLADQLRRAALSITLNIAEGAGEFAPAEKSRFYRMAKRSATESAAGLDVLRELAGSEPTTIKDGDESLLQIVAMLIKLCKSLEKPREPRAG